MPKQKKSKHRKSKKQKRLATKREVIKLDKELKETSFELEQSMASELAESPFTNLKSTYDGSYYYSMLLDNSTYVEVQKRGRPHLHWSF